MAYQTLNVQKHGNIMIISLMEPREAPGGICRLSDELNELSGAIAWDDETRVVILTGAGEKAFIFERDTEKTDSGEDEGQPGSWPMAEHIAGIDQPVIAAVNGDAIGQGLEMVLACDIRVAVEGSRFGLTQIRKGLIPWDGGTQRLGRLVGRAKALEMVLTGDTIDAGEALRIGLINKVVSPGELMETAKNMAREMASRGPIALRYAKEAVCKGMDLTLEQGLRLEADLYLLIHTTRDRVEGIRAFKERRPSKFEGE